MIKVKELIEQLNKLSEEQKDFVVKTEGCDCVGLALGLEIDEKSVIITRDHLEGITA